MAQQLTSLTEMPDLPPSNSKSSDMNERVRILYNN